jgi:hypothetical protein
MSIASKAIYPHLASPTETAQGNTYHIPFYMAEDESAFPVITFVQIQNESVTNIQKPQDVEMSGGELVQAALSNLKAAAQEWTEHSFPGGNPYLLLEGEHLIAEKILDQEFVKIASRRLGADTILLAIPHKGLIMAAGMESKREFEQVVSSTLTDYRYTPLSDMLYQIKDGRIEQHHRVILRKSADDSGPVMEMKIPEGFSFSSAEIPLINGKYYLKVQVQSETDQTLIDGLQYVLLNLTHEHAHRKEFMGAVEIQTHAGAPAKTPALDKMIIQFFNRVSEHPVLKKYANRSGGDLAITFLHGADFKAGNMHLKMNFQIKP